MSEPRNILHIISRLDGYGTARQLLHLAREQIAEGYRLRVVALESGRQVRASWEKIGLPCRVLQRRWKFDPFAAWRLSDLLLQELPGVIHAWDADAVNYSAVARLRVARVPLVATFLTAPPVDHWLASQVDRLVVGSSKLSHEYAKRGVASEKLIVAQPAIGRIPESSLSREQMLTALKLPTDSQVIVVAGSLKRSQLVDEAIWCFELIRALNEQVVLLIFGEGPDRERLERFTRLVSEPAVVKFMGYRDDFRHWLSKADVFWHPGEETSISSVVLESMAARVPVVASDLPAHRELIENGRTGFLAPLGSRAALARHTLRLLEDPVLASEISKAAAEEISKRFPSSAIEGAYRDLYRHLPKTAKPLE